MPNQQTNPKLVQLFHDRLRAIAVERAAILLALDALDLPRPTRRRRLVPVRKRVMASRDTTFRNRLYARTLAVVRESSSPLTPVQIRTKLRSTNSTVYGHLYRAVKVGDLKRGSGGTYQATSA